jgi:magnesium transporter
LISVREAPPFEGDTFVDAARQRFDRTRPGHTTVGFLLYVLLDELVDDYFDATEVTEDTLEQLEDSIFAEDVADERAVQEQLFGVRRRLVEFRRAVVPLRDVMSALLRKEVEWIDDAAVIHLQDVYDHVLRVVDHLDSQRELMGNAVDAHLAIISNRMNRVMKRMTSWGAILLGSTLVAGIYGMNFTHMPELKWRLGYPYALGLMVVITVTGYRYFKKRDYL